MHLTPGCLFLGCYKAVSWESCPIMWNNCNTKCRQHLMFLSSQVFPFPDVLECCLVLLHLGSQCPPELQEEALALLRKHGSAGVYKKALSSFLTWHLESRLSPLSCLQLLNTKAALFFKWRLLVMAVAVTDTKCQAYTQHPLVLIHWYLFKETVRKLKSSRVWAWTVITDFCMFFSCWTLC